MTRSSTLVQVLRVLWAALTFRLVRYEIAEESMLPALAPGDWVAGIRRPGRLRVGHVVVVRTSPGFDMVKRVAPTPPGAEGLWLLGDNPEAGSVDSRSRGPFAPGSVRARLLLRYQPRPFRPL